MKRIISNFLIISAFVLLLVDGQGRSVARTKAQFLKTHSIGMPYIDDVLQSRWFDFGGHTVINTNKYIRLTSTQSSQQGYLWSRLPLTEENFQVEFEFQIGGSPSENLYGDGFAMWLATQKNSIGTVFGSVNPFKGLGIFFDTYRNEMNSTHEFPYISCMLGDGSTLYENDKDGRTTELAGCEASFRNRDISTLARFTYYKNNYLQLEVQYKEEGLWTECFKVHGIILPEHIYLGFTAHTGELSDNHDIISVVTRALTPILKEDIVVPKPIEKKGNGGFAMFCFKMVIAGSLMSIVYMGYKMYEQKIQKQF